MSAARAAARALAALAVALAGSGCASLPTDREIESQPGPQAPLVAQAALVDGRSRFREVFCGLLSREPGVASGGRPCASWLWSLDDEPAAPRRPLPTPDTTPQVYLVTGAFSECLGEAALPFHGVTEALLGRGYRIATIVVAGRSGSASNARQIAARLAAAPPSENGPAVMVGYSKGANDVLEFLVRYPQLAARVEAVVSVAGAIGGTPLAARASGIYDLLLGHLPSRRCPAGDAGVVDSLRPEVRREWLAQNPLPRHVRFYSLAAIATRPRVARVMVPTWEQLLRDDRRNDGQLLARDALIPGGTLLGYLNADHWSAVLDVEAAHPFLGKRRDALPYPRAALLEAILLQLAELRGR